MISATQHVWRTILKFFWAPNEEILISAKILRTYQINDLCCKINGKQKCPNNHRIVLTKEVLYKKE